MSKIAPPRSKFAARTLQLSLVFRLASWPKLHRTQQFPRLSRDLYRCSRAHHLGCRFDSTARLFVLSFSGYPTSLSYGIFTAISVERAQPCLLRSSRRFHTVLTGCAGSIRTSIRPSSLGRTLYSSARSLWLGQTFLLLGRSNPFKLRYISPRRETLWPASAS